ncbi:hypothetical protein L0664_04205 [Octadecabacter sp. G9-8]|uniref:Secreted protein n=1 Tax=Octadecabacter dasysiphoniae TaxID=2909341 RepID=A0ABS9CSQ6_9RHOB|nr:hypothetical protein [Octadecabacter dasysiphoniae]MCF2870261.1 hypothetical protein [Octadecabacter dasysiphoniae]
MQPKSFLLIALLAPQTAAAFGDLDCITIESCENGGCGPRVEPFAVMFDWSDETATVEAVDVQDTLAWTFTGESEDRLASVLEYGDLTETESLLRIEASGLDITAYYTFKTPSVTTWVATCDVRKAA